VYPKSILDSHEQKVCMILGEREYVKVGFASKLKLDVVASCALEKSAELLCLTSLQR